jgi:hypothetical protein
VSSVSSDGSISVDSIEPVAPAFLPLDQIQPQAYTIEPIAETTAAVDPAVTNTATDESVKKTSTTKKVVSTVLTALGAGALLGI